MLYLDDAHGTGVLGNGLGSLSHYGLSPQPWLVQMVSLGKALGSFGALVAGSHDVIAWLRNNARSLMYSTALPAAVVATAIEALKIVKEDVSFNNILLANRDKLINGLRQIGLDTGQTQTPIIPLFTKTVDDAIQISQQLMELSIYAPAIRPPTVRTPRLRISVTARHTEEDIQKLLASLKTTWESIGK